jgi:ATP-dependent helicase/nuclease subunit B
MSFLSMNPRRHFLTWDRPLATQAAAWCLARAEGSPGCPDLGGWMVLVPTAEAGRLLRQELVRLSGRGAVLAPVVCTPAQWLPGQAPGLAKPTERLLAWTEVLLSVDLTAFPHLFPVPPVNNDREWAADLAAMLDQTQQALLDAGLSLSDVARRGDSLRDPERWGDLQSLEQSWLRKLRQMGLTSPADAWRDFAPSPQLPPGVRQVALAGLPDPIPWTLRALAALPQVDVLVHAPEAEADAFDPWGRPTVESWSGRPLRWNASADTLHLRLNEEAVARRAAALVQAHRHSQAALIGLARESLAAAVVELIPQAHDPAGSPACGHEVWSFLNVLRRWLATGRIDALAALLQHPAGAEAWAARGAAAAGPTWAALDRLVQRHLVRTEADLAEIESEHEEDRPVLRALAAATVSWRHALEGKQWVEALGDLVNAAWKRRALDSVGRDLLETALDLLQRHHGHQRVLLHARVEDHLAWVVEALAGQRLSISRPANAVEMKGWLELAWDPRPHLILTGLQEGDVPFTRAAEIFLPESLRAELGLRTQAQLFARDAYLFQAMAAQRAESGRLDVILAKFSDGGEPLQPSRLLFQCTDAELPSRASALFAAVADDGGATPAPSGPLPLTLVPRAPAKKRISVTHFAQFLESPLLFFLQRTLAWETVDPHKQEMDALDFGTLAHEALEQLGHHPALRTSTDASKIHAFLLAELDRVADARFGLRKPLGVEVQLDALSRRLERFAFIQAGQAAAGWSIEATEVKFTWNVAGWTVTGKIDRIDRHRDGRVRLLDYKTSESPTSPMDAHILTPRAGAASRRPPEACFTWQDKPRAWASLQLPIYLLKWEEDHPQDRGQVTCGYINLPRALQSVDVSIWDGYSPDLGDEARACVLRVLKALDAGTCGPAFQAECWKKEPWFSWMPGGPQASIVWTEGPRV